MKNLIVLLVCGVFFFTCGCEEEHRTKIKVIGVSPAGDVKINAGEDITNPRGVWPFIDVMNYDIFDDTETCVARIIITQTFPTYSIGTITTRLDGSGTRPDPKNIAEGMVCRKTTTETLRAEKRIYKNQKKAFKRQYKLSKLRGKSGVYKSLGDPNTPAVNIGVTNIKDD